MRLLSIIVLLTFVSVGPQLAHSGTADSPLKISVYKNTHGMVSGEVNAIHEDRRGFIWLGTSNGLSRFDSYEFVHFRSNYLHPDFFSSNTIYDIKEDALGRLWLATANGVNVFDPADHSVLKIQLGESRNQKVNTIEIYDDKTVLIGAVVGLYYYDMESGILSKFNRDADGNRPGISSVRDIRVDDQGNVWLGTWRKGLMVIDWRRNRILDISYLNLPPNLTVTRFMDCRDGGVLVSTWGDGVFKLSDPLDSRRSGIAHFAHDRNDEEHLDRNIIYDMAYGPDDLLWLGTPKGLTIVDETRQGFTGPVDLTGVLPTAEMHEIHRLFRDSHGSVWLSDYGKGIMQVSERGNAIREVDLSGDGLNFNIVTAIYPVDQSLLWLGVQGVGLVQYDLVSGNVVRSSSPYISKINSESNSINGFARSVQTGEIFLATRYDGVYRVNYDKGTVTSSSHYDLRPHSQRNSFTSGIWRDSSDDMWVATRGGVLVLVYDRDRGCHVVHEPEALNDSLQYDFTETVIRDGSGRVWVGTSESGLYSAGYDIAEGTVSDFRHYSVENRGLNNNKVQCVYEDSRSVIWVGTHGGGLCSYDSRSDSFRIIDNMHFISSDVISSITEDREGNLWLATGNGIVCYDPRAGSSAIRNFGTQDGNRNVSFIKGAIARSDGRVYLGGYFGFSFFDPAELTDDSAPATPSIVEVQIGNTSLAAMDGKQRSIRSALMPPYTEDITLSHRDHSISIKFAAPGIVNAGLGKYAYLLEGVDREWNYVTASQRTVTYSNLSPGKYTFLVKASNDMGNWNEEPATLHITVLPPPWKSVWAYALYLLTATFAGVTAYRTVRNRLRLKRALEIEQIERLKSEEVNNAKLTFFTNVSHELFTPITIMSTSLEKLLSENEEDRQLHAIIRSNLNRLMRLLQQIMEFRKADSANLQLRVSRTGIVEFVKRICDENFAPLVTKRNIRLEFICDLDELFGYIDTDKLDKIVYNLLSNAFKYNRPDGRVYVSIDTWSKEDGLYLQLAVRDTGRGIDPEKLPHLFKRFYEGDYRKFRTKGTGIGLSLTRDLVKLHNGDITVESEPGQGTIFTVTLPIDRSAYGEDQIEEITEPDESRREPARRVDSIPHSNAGKEGDTRRDTILVAEDSDELLLVMCEVLRDYYNVIPAANGVEALDILSRELPDIIVTDFLMPEMDGAELTARIRQDGSLCHIPVVMLSARSEAEAKLESFKAGADAYIAKPFDVQLLRAQVDGLISNRRKVLENFRRDHILHTEGIINTELDKQFIHKAVALIEKHISDPGFDINAFNSAMNMSNSTLYRKIKSLTGMSPKEFIRNIRFKVACRLLMEQTANISEVSYMVGFSDAKYFSLSFKKEFGMTPREYTQRHRQAGKKG